MQVPPSPDLALPPPEIASVLNNYSPGLYRQQASATASAHD